MNGKMPEGLIYISLSGIFYDTFFRYKESVIFLFFCVPQGMQLPDRVPTSLLQLSITLTYRL